MGISVWEPSCGDVRLQSSMRGGPGELEPGPPGQPVLPTVREQRQARGFPSPWELGCSRASRDGGRRRVLLQVLREWCPAGTVSRQASGAVAFSVGSHLLLLPCGPWTTVMAPSRSLHTGCSKACPSAVSQSKRALPDTPDCGRGAVPWATSRHGAGAARLRPHRFAFRHFSAVCNMRK